MIWIQVRDGKGILSRLGFWFGGIGDAGYAVGIDGGVSAKEEAADVSEDGGTARGDAIFGDKLKEIGEGEVDALRGLEVLRGFEEEFGVVFL